MLKDGQPTPDDCVELDGKPVKELCILGRVVDREQGTLRQDLMLNDSTTCIRAIFYQKEQDSNPKAFANYKFRRNAYVKIYGTYRSFKGETVIVGHRIEEVGEHTEIVNHLLRVFVAHKERSQGPILAAQAK